MPGLGGGGGVSSTGGGIGLLLGGGSLLINATNHSKVTEHSICARYCWCNSVWAEGLQKNKHAIYRVTILSTQHPHYLCYFSL